MNFSFKVRIETAFSLGAIPEQCLFLPLGQKRHETTPRHKFKVHTDLVQSIIQL
jgi:hypothetical protein